MERSHVNPAMHSVYVYLTSTLELTLFGFQTILLYSVIHDNLVFKMELSMKRVRARA